MSAPRKILKREVGGYIGQFIVSQQVQNVRRRLSFPQDKIEGRLAHPEKERFEIIYFEAEGDGTNKDRARAF